MKTAATRSWPEANQRYLTAALAVVRSAIEQHMKSGVRKGCAAKRDATESVEQRLKQAAAAMPAPPALETLCGTFGLSSFERDTLLMCAGIELDSRFGALCAAAQDDPARPWPTWSLALAVLPGAHWSALTPTAPLRRWRLIEIGSGHALTTSSLRIDERVLHYLAGVSHVDERLMGIIEPVSTPDELVPSHRTLANVISSAWSTATGTGTLPVIQLLGREDVGKPAIAASACATLGLRLQRMAANLVPVVPAELEALQRVWEREAALTSSALLLDCDESDTADSMRESVVAKWIESTRGAIIVTSRCRRRSLQRATVALEVHKPASQEQRMIWNRTLGDKAVKLNGHVNGLICQFDLNEASIRSACAQAQSNPDQHSSARTSESLWDACRAQGRPRLDDLAQRLEPAASWDDLVLPEQQIQTLREIAMHVRQRWKVYESWGFAAKCVRGLGISALFAGASGTGKTMAAEVLANELRLDLYRVDLSQAVSKYIGETEKNLRRIFDAAEDGGAVLLFDEADALFGKRSEVKDSHDRYANIEVSYLLQRMEAYRGLAILTTNMKTALDPAFQRRIRFVVQFPFPDAAQRVRIWQRIFPSTTPTEKLEMNRLARLNVAGGNIRNIALNAAFLAAEANQPVKMGHVLQAARSEYSKLEKPLTESETGGWVL